MGWKPPSKIFNSDSTKPNRLLLMVAENKFRNSKPECENSKTNLTPNSDELPIPSRTPERSNEKSKKSPTKPKKTRRTCLESKTWSTNSRSKSKPTNDRPKKLKKLPTPTSANTESFSTNWMRPKNEPIWPNPPSTNFELKPDNTKQNNKIINVTSKNIITSNFVYPLFFKNIIQTIKLLSN